MSAIENFDSPPPGWFVLEVLRAESRKWDWSALMIDVDPDEYIAGRIAACRSCFVRIAGKHKNRDAAWAALEEMMSTRH